MYRAVLAGAMLALVLPGCGEDAGNGEAGTPTGTESRTRTESPTEPREPPEEDDMTDQPAPVARAIADLAGQTGVEPSAVELVSFERVTWRDGSLGCPQPGMMYTQALVEGYRVTLRLNGQTVLYHGAEGQPPFRCDNPAPGGAHSASPAS